MSCPRTREPSRTEAIKHNSSEEANNMPRRQGQIAQEVSHADRCASLAMDGARSGGAGDVAAICRAK